MFDVHALVGLGRVNALVPEPGGNASVAVVERLDADGAKYVSDLWLVPHDGSAARRLTQGESRDRAPTWLADGTLLFVSDRAIGKDDARAQVWALPPRGEAFVVTDEPHGVSDFKAAGTTLVVLCELLPGVAHDEQRKTLADKKKHGPSVLKFTGQPVRFWDHWLGPTEPRLVAYDLDGAKVGNRRELTADAGDALREHSWDLSPDGRHVAITWAVMSPADRIHDKPVALIATLSGARTMVGQGDGIVHAAPRFTKDGQRLVAQRYVRSRDGYAQRTLWCYELPDGAAREMYVGAGGWDRWPGPWAVLPNGSVLATAEDAGRILLHVIDEHGPRVVGPTTGSWDNVAWVPNTNAVVGVRSGMLTPPEPFHLDLGTNVLTPLATLSGFVPVEGISAHELRVEVATVGERRREMAAYVVEPATPNGRTAVWIHGGPVYAWMDHWHWRWSALALAAKGYRVVLPNPSGSTGFGIDWVNDIWGNCWGDRCYDDLMRLVAHLEASGTAPRDIAVMGASFGGYMTNWIGGHDTRFRALVTHASVFHMSAFHGVTDFPAWWELMMQGAPWSDGDYDRYSPSRFVQGWKTPTLVLHGERDYRVPLGEGLALFEALQAHGVWSELVVFPDENHWVLKPRNAVAWYEATLDFLDRVWAAT